MKDWLNEHKFYVIIAVFISCAGFYYFYADGYEEPTPANALSIEKKIQDVGKETENEKKQEKTEQPEKIMVDVKGQVKLPGVYQATTGERVIDLISRAGGLTSLADQTQVNFAEHVQDEMVIYIPAQGEEGFEAIGSTGGSPAKAGDTGQNQGKIDLNKADETELQTLPGIGPAKAAAIIEYRESSGPFKAIEDLKNISGIGDKTFEKLKELIVVH